MKRLFLIATALIGAAICATSTVCGEENPYISIVARADTAKQFELYEVDLAVNADHDNACDPDEIDVSAIFITPDQKRVVVPAFFTGKENLWKIRYTPSKIGRFTLYLSIKTKYLANESGPHYFEVLPGKSDGFIRKGKNNPYYPAFDSGKAFFGLGHNIAWVTNNNSSTYEKYFDEFSKNGCNLTRVWLNNPWTLKIEYSKLGEYDYDDSGKFDELLKLAEKYGIYIVLVLDSYGSLMEEAGPWGEEAWTRNPYNKANGGPCDGPLDFFKNKTAIKFYKNRLRYIIARWGYSPNIIAFELWNEFDAPEAWTKDVTDYIRSTNPHGQMITTSLGYPWGNNFNELSIWKLPCIDIIERHVYGNQVGNTVQNILSVNKEYSAKYNKPCFVGEFGLNANQSDKNYDPDGNGTALHNSLWASLVSRSFAGALNWWWDDYVKPKYLYAHYKALRNFVNTIDFTAKHIGLVRSTPLSRQLGNGERMIYEDVTVSTRQDWGNLLYREFTITNDGDVLGGSINAYLHGSYQNDIRINPVFHVYYPTDGRFIIQVGMVSQGGRLVVYIDDKEVLSKDFPAGPGNGPWQKSMYRKDEDIYHCLYNVPIGVAVPRGDHTIRLVNTGLDWISIKKITLTNYKSNLMVNARMGGIVVGKDIILWIQNKDFSGEKILQEKGPTKITRASCILSDVEAGAYTVEWWDTFTGKIISRQTVIAEKKYLKLYVPEFTKDIACKIRR